MRLQATIHTLARTVQFLSRGQHLAGGLQFAHPGYILIAFRSFNSLRSWMAEVSGLLLSISRRSVSSVLEESGTPL